MNSVKPQRLPPGASPILRSRSPAMRLAVERAQLYADLDRPLLLVGPVGSGKTTLARLVHQIAAPPGELVILSGGEEVEGLLHDRLFGHVSGAFTGADGVRKGLLERAQRGTLFIDDAAYLPHAAQLALLRVLEDRKFSPLGASRDLLLISREIYATTRDPADLVHEGAWTADFESRVQGFRIDVPGIDQRREDIPDLVDLFAATFLAEHGERGVVFFSGDVVDALTRFRWKGNLRELRRVVERAVVHAGMRRTEIRVEARHLPDRVVDFADADGVDTPRLTRALVTSAVEAAGGNRSEAARRLGVHRNTIARYLGQAG